MRLMFRSLMSIIFRDLATMRPWLTASASLRVVSAYPSSPGRKPSGVRAARRQAVKRRNRAREKS